MQLFTTAPGSQPQGIYLRRAVHPVVWALLFSCVAHGVLLLQTFAFKVSQPNLDKAQGLIVRWLAPPPPVWPAQAAGSTLAFSSEPKSIEPVRATAKNRANNFSPPALLSEPALSPQPNIATPSPPAGAEPSPIHGNAPQAAPPTSPGARPATGSGVGAEPLATNQAPQLDLSRASLARAASESNVSSLAEKARVRIGSEPDPPARVFAKRLATAAIPSCWSDTQDGEGQPLVAPSGNLLYLPTAMRDAVVGKCKVVP